MTTIVDTLDSLRVPVVGEEHRHGRAGWVNVDCPFCQGQGKYHLGINLQFGSANCWKCGRHSLYEVLLKFTGSAAHTRELLDALQLGRPPTKSPVSGRLRRPHGVGPLTPSHRAYLRRRGLDADLCTRLWGAAGIGIASRLQWRVYIPIYRYGDEVSWTTRAIGRKAVPRYVNASPQEESVPAKELLYGEDYCRTAVIVHEGPLDVWRTGPGSVALFGLNYTQSQVASIAEYPLRVICLDNSEQAQAVARRLAGDLAVFPGDTVSVQLESGKDPGSADPEETEELRKFLL